MPTAITGFVSMSPRSMAMALMVAVLSVAAPACSETPRLVDTEPAANENAIIYDNLIYLEFDQPIDPAQSSVQVTDAKGRAISVGVSTNEKDPKVLNVQVKAPTLAGYDEGHYTVKWSVKTQSNEAAQGEYAFHIRAHH